MKLAISIPGLFLLTVWTVGCLWFDGPESRLWARLRFAKRLFIPLDLPTFLIYIGPNGISLCSR
jgi:hypothetical protein